VAGPRDSKPSGDASSDPSSNSSSNSSSDPSSNPSIDPSSQEPSGKDVAKALAGAEAERRRLAAAIADLEGAQRRVERDAEQAKQAARASLLEELFPVLDNLDRSLAAADGASGGALLAGVRMVRENLEQVLLRYGAERIQAAGRPFDPQEHEAVGMQPVQSQADDGRVVSEWRAGYKFGDRVLRAAQVLVGKLAAITRRS
jgi:molecular chaperone GrpE